MRISFSVANINVAVVDNDGKQILSYEVKELDVNADPVGLVTFIEEVQEQVQAKIEEAMTNTDVQAAIERARESTKQ